MPVGITRDRSAGCNINTSETLFIIIKADEPRGRGLDANGTTAGLGSNSRALHHRCRERHLIMNV